MPENSIGTRFSLLHLFPLSSSIQVSNCRQAELLERKRLKKHRQKEQKTKGQANGEKMPKSPSFGRSGLYSTQNPQAQTRKPEMENEGKSLKSILLTDDVAKTHQHKTREVMISFMSVPLGYCTAQWHDDDLIEAQEHCSTEHAISKPTKIVHGGSQSTVKLWRSCASGDNGADSPLPVDESAPAEGLLFSSNCAKAFLAQSMVRGRFQVKSMLMVAVKCIFYGSMVKCNVDYLYF
ncbi:hypothetical protein RHGRI_013264 [Rhododendron griersonianum]|uniref:Uncharacterized protein n=1 Tax=Rhododendron griersonianum TaxID=479676 RepID=A0AAV6K596_9ERIC|nr:hypothetical protein RHGRI_013264 [Rhododendron griersonianum]